MKLSLVVPVFNELATIEKILLLIREALASIEIEIVVVDDCSTDGTREWLVANAERLSIALLLQQRNGGKGAALRAGLAAATGDVLVIQDADLEYDPADLLKMWDLISRRKVADVVFGCRFHGAAHRSLYYHHYLGNRLISTLFNLLYNQFLLDIEVCYKMFTREVLNRMTLTASDFGIEVEIAARVARARTWRIYEIEVQYFGRTYAEGKKIRMRDGLKALWYLVKYRLDRPRAATGR